MRFGTVGAPISTPAKPGGSVGAIQRIHEMKLDAFELGWVQAVRVTEKTCELIKEEGKKQEVALSVHAPYFINLNAEESEWPKSRKRLWDAAYYGYLAGATDIIFHPGSYFGREPNEVLKVAIPRLQELTTELAAKEIHVTLRPETMGKGALFGSFTDALEMSKQVPGVLPCLDFAHLHARSGDGSVNSKIEWFNLVNGYANLLGSESLKSLHIHLSGIEYTNKGEKKHLPLRASDLNIKELLGVLVSSGCSGRILCESPILEEDALYMQQLWNELS
jgi:deoxyribonuclease-4